MGIQYVYALLTMLPAPIWFWYRWPSALFLMSVFMWSIWNGANYYIDVFGLRFQKELEQLKRDVAKWQMSPDIGPKTPGVGVTPGHVRNPSSEGGEYFSLGAAMMNNPAAVATGTQQTPGVATERRPTASELLEREMSREYD
ncbi:hypothetical protein FH972_023860 [Carpinus fangiana]|uniref:Glycerophosphocholine acyltransferase 1 n=1 Tax=Carpinus fangiana TaxID=176857 RepID=A0A5N6KWN1_9ROSI|nr:hypothetical protein FH972_023860 [Carpinus fangiana]